MGILCKPEDVTFQYLVNKSYKTLWKGYGESWALKNPTVTMHAADGEIEISGEEVWDVDCDTIHSKEQFFIKYSDITNIQQTQDTNLRLTITKATAYGRNPQKHKNKTKKTGYGFVEVCALPDERDSDHVIITCISNEEKKRCAKLIRDGRCATIQN